MASVVPPPPLSSHVPVGISAEDLTRIDINHLSQSELQALSLCSVSARLSDDVVSPQLDRSVFNESAGSRRQTYSRLHHRSHSRLPRLHPSPKPHSFPKPSSDPVSNSIVHFLKHFLKGDHNPPPPPQDSPKAAAPELGFLGLQENMKFKRKRARRGSNLSKPMVLGNGVGMELQRVNGKGEMVDFAELEKKGDELYGDELKRRTAGLETEEAILGVLRDLEGEWCSRRKKRKYVDASAFGDALPVGWKLLLGLRRRGYRVSVYCRRYISPTGQQFLSCIEAASFLRSYFSSKDADQQRNQKTSSLQQAYALSSEMSACIAGKTDDMPHAIVAHSAPAINSAHENEDSMMGIENLPEVQVRDIFECFKCKLTFDKKNVYLQHLFSFHQKTTKRYKLGTPVGEGVIIKDGKYECQFCHKVFQERRSYNGHVGSHVRNTGKSSGKLGDAPINAESALLDGEKPSKMDALVEIAHDSIFETSTNVNVEETTANQSSAVVLRVEEAQAASSCLEGKLTPDPVKIQAEDCSADKTLLEDLDHGSQALTKDNGIPNDDKSNNVIIKTNTTCISDSGPARSREIRKCENSSLEVNHENRSLQPSEDHLQNAPELTVEEIMFEGGVSSGPLSQSFQFFPPFDSMSNKGEHEFSVVDQKLENVTGFEELGFDDMEPFKYGFGNEQELSLLPGGSINLDSNNGMEDEFNTSVGFGQEEIMLNTLHTNQLTVCVWCRAEFKLEGFESETLSDSIGYMCPTCKAKISGHFDGGLSMDSHNF
ncbi:hypothetical protein SASPL_118544 [Salvia splendens]|uniref:C2H2-type domain-containing protein n=1 Tax=Salvia splendens TaxID=180675 RepID=A0A8X8Y1U5_SALSN|nr:uncharacterized protein LOC121808488 [Salvia splendens]KAG6421983.1 hypothetical protein SASPL_118544 [Salvia splendens]